MAQDPIQRGLRAAGVMLVLGIVWLGVLPWLGEQPGAREFITRMEGAGIDPSAMYYSELGTLEETEATFRELREESPELFWQGHGP